MPFVNSNSGPMSKDLVSTAPYNASNDNFRIFDLYFE